MDSSLGACLLTLSAHLALLGIDIGKIVLQGDGLELLTGLHTPATADAGALARLVGHSTLVLVVAQHHHTAALRTLQADFNHTARTSLGTGSTGRTLLLIHLVRY